jgi:hypothetical protein
LPMRLFPEYATSINIQKFIPMAANRNLGNVK